MIIFSESVDAEKKQPDFAENSCLFLFFFSLFSLQNYLLAF